MFDPNSNDVEFFMPSGVKYLGEALVPVVTFLVLADPASTSAKAEKARKLGVKVISEDQLIALTSGKWNGL